MPLSNNSQNPLFSAPLSLSLPPNRHPNEYLDKYPNSNIDYLNDKLNSDTIKALYVSDSVNRGTSTARGTRKPVRLVVYKRGSKARERKGEEEQRRLK